MSKISLVGELTNNLFKNIYIENYLNIASAKGKSVELAQTN